MGLAEGEHLLSHSIALWERWIIDDWQLWHLISETLCCQEALHRSRPLETLLHQNCLERSQTCLPGSLCAGSVPLLRQQYIMQCLAWIHTRSVSEAGRACRDKEWPHCFLLVSTLRRWLQDNCSRGCCCALALLGRWWVPCSARRSWFPGMCGAGSLIYMHNILQALGKEQCWAMWTAEELGLTFSLGTARNPRPYNVKNPKTAQV